MTRTLSRNTNIKDVARHAGVSYQTVSRVINDHPSVASATRQRVKDAILALNYHPSSVARDLGSRRTSTLGVISFGVTHYGPAQMLSSLESAARQLGYRLSTVSVGELSITEISEAIQELRSQRVAGIIMITPLLQVQAAHIDELCRDLPFVLIDAEPQADQHVLAIDQFVGGRLAAQHLIGLGHSEIALLGGPGGWYDAIQRRQGWLSALHQVGISPVAEAEGDWTATGGYALTLDLLSAQRPFTAMLAGNDQMALGAMRALRERGLDMPLDVSIVGFDDVPEAAFYHPPLTTVRQDFKTLGQRSLDQIIGQIEHPAGATGVSMLLPTLTVRGSTAPPAGSGRATAPGS